MRSPDQARRFLQWYEGEREERRIRIEESMPDWFVDFYPVISDGYEQSENLVSLEDYDMETRLDNRIDGQEFVPEQEAIEVVERDWHWTTDEEGFEAVAWYVPFHYSTRAYGIYITERGVRLLGDLLYAWSNGYESQSRPSMLQYEGKSLDSLKNGFDLAFEILLRHEWYHHQSEIFATYLEDLADRLLYQEYHEEAYRATYPKIDCIEESLANAYVARSRACYNRSPSASAFRTLFELSTQRQPSAYRAYSRFGSQSFRVGGRHLAYLHQTANATNISNHIGDTTKQRHFGTRIPLDTSISRFSQSQRIPINIVQEPPSTPYLTYHRTVDLDTKCGLSYTSEASEHLENLPDEVSDRVVNKLEQATECTECRLTSLSGYPYHRLRVGDYRAIVSWDQGADTITAEAVGHRRNVYDRHLPP